jgi:hypothetical protein
VNAPLVSTMDEAAAATHEMFMSYVRAGFTRAEALAIVIALMNQHKPDGGGEDAAT